MAQPDRETLEAVQLTGPTMGSSSIRTTDSAYERGHVGGRVSWTTEPESFTLNPLQQMPGLNI